jgi:hypothetical protein
MECEPLRGVLGVIVMLSHLSLVEVVGVHLLGSRCEDPTNWRQLAKPYVSIDTQQAGEVSSLGWLCTAGT